MRCLSVCLSVCLSWCLSRWCTMSKRANVFSKLFTVKQPTILVFFSYQKVKAIFRQGRYRLTGVSNAGGLGKNRDSVQISGFRVDDWWNVVSNFDRRQFIALSVDVRVSRRRPHISESCLWQQVSTRRPKRTEQNRTCVGAYALVNVKPKYTVKDFARCSVLLKLLLRDTNYRPPCDSWTSCIYIEQNVSVCYHKTFIFYSYRDT